jgi:hypothetical protein
MHRAGLTSLDVMQKVSLKWMTVQLATFLRFSLLAIARP